MNLKLAKRIEDLPPYLFARLDNLRREKEAQGIDVISLGIGDPDLATPNEVIDELAAAANNPRYHRYNDSGLESFRQAISEWYKKRFNITLDSNEEIVPLIGSKEGIAHLPLALVDPDDYVIVPDPGYPVYSIGAQLLGGKVYSMKLRPDCGWTPDFSAVPSEVAAKAKLLWINYPNNPTAAAGSDEVFQQAIEFGLNNDVVICQDAAYSEVTFDGWRPSSILNQQGARDCCIEFHSLSKTYNMTGWRIGWAAGNATVVEAIARVKSNIDSGAFAAIEEAGIAALKLDHSWIQARNNILQQRRDKVLSALRSIGLDPEVPSASLYVWTPCPSGHSSSEFAARLIEEIGVLVTPGVGFGPNGDTHFRISLTTSEELLQEALDRIAGLNIL